MNERILELAEQARKKPMGDSWTYRYFGEFEEKFAELIVRECAGVTLDYKNGDHYAGWCDHAKEILKHFGVEE